ncbi:phosphatase PAP2 family protein [bacterium]|nr:phosphatase PAP2 family protein [bacterium]
MPIWLQNIDAALFLLLNRGVANPVFDVVMPFITEADHWTIPMALGFLALIIFGGKKGRITAALVVVIIALTDQITCAVIKPLVGRVRPCFVLESARLLIGQSGSPSFPSAHASNNAAIAMMVLLRYPRAKWWFIGLALSVAYSRIYVGVHYPVDVLAGLLLGAAIGFGVVRGWNRIEKWLASRRSKTEIHLN